MQPSSKYLHNEEIVSTYSIVDVCTKVFIHEETKEQVDAYVVPPSQKGPLPGSTYIEQNYDLQIECKQSNQDISGLLENQSVDLMCMIDDIPFFEDLPKYDQYDDNYVLQIQANFTKKSLASLWDEEVQFQQLKYSDQIIHIKSSEILKESSIPLCFKAFQFLKDEQPLEIYEVPLKPVYKLQQSFKVFHDQIADVMNDKCNQNLSPLTKFKLQYQYDKSFSRHACPSVEISSQSLSESL